jgi:hypothetical protein
MGRRGSPPPVWAERGRSKAEVRAGRVRAVADQPNRSPRGGLDSRPFSPPDCRSGDGAAGVGATRQVQLPEGFAEGLETGAPSGAARRGRADGVARSSTGLASGLVIATAGVGDAADGAVEQQAQSAPQAASPAVAIIVQAAAGRAIGPNTAARPAIIASSAVVGQIRAVGRDMQRTLSTRSYRRGTWDHSRRNRPMRQPRPGRAPLSGPWVRSQSSDPA